MRVDIGDDPAVIQISLRLDICEDEVVGKLHRLWSWADKHTTTGCISAITEKWIDRFLCHPGFAAAMVETHWLDFTPDGIEFPSFDRHNGETAKKRAVENRRKGALRSKTPICPSNGGTNLGQNTDTCPVIERTNPGQKRGPEKRREEKRKEEQPPLPPKGDIDFVSFWEVYPKKDGKGYAIKAWEKAKKSKTLPHIQAVLLAIEREKQSTKWLKDGGQFIPNPATWINGQGWENGAVQGEAGDADRFKRLKEEFDKRGGIRPGDQKA